MDRAEILLTIMDKIQSFIATINEYIEMGIELFLKARDWVQKMLSYIEQGIDRLVNAIGGRKEDLLEFHEDDLFV